MVGIHDLPDSALQLIAQHITSFPKRYAPPLRPLHWHMRDTVFVPQISAAQCHCGGQESAHNHAPINTQLLCRDDYVYDNRLGSCFETAGVRIGHSAIGGNAGRSCRPLMFAYAFGP